MQTHTFETKRVGAMEVVRHKRNIELGVPLGAGPGQSRGGNLIHSVKEREVHCNI